VNVKLPQGEKAFVCYNVMKLAVEDFVAETRVLIKDTASHWATEHQFLKTFCNLRRTV
jgi:hypothetical protein